MSLGLSFSSAEYEDRIFFFDRFCRFAVIVKTVNLFFLIICAFSMSFYIWTYARALIRFTFSRILSFSLIIVKIILSEFRPLEAFRDLYY
jgi:hypothetical protein